MHKHIYKQRNEIKPSILWVRAFHNIYNPKMAINAVKIVKKNYPNVKLCMVGAEKDNSLKDCKKLVKEYQLEENISFQGFLSKNDWLELSKEYDVFLNTTNVESFGLSVIEAAACGLIICTTNSGELKNLYKHKKNAMLNEKNDYLRLSKNLMNVFDDKALAKSLSENARKFSESFDWKILEKEWIDIIEMSQK